MIVHRHWLRDWPLARGQGRKPAGESSCYKKGGQAGGQYGVSLVILYVNYTLYEFVEWRALIPYCSSVSRLYVRLVIWLNTSHMIIPSHPLHPSPGCTWTWSIVFRLGSLIRSSHPILFIGHQQVRELGQQIIHLIIPSHLLHPSPVRTWTWSIVLRSLIRSFHSIFYIRRQKVRESGQLF